MSVRLIEPAALVALMAGLNEKALALLHNDFAPGATYLRARAFFRLGHFQRAITELEQANLQTLVPEEIAAALPLHAFVLARVGRVGEAYARLDELRNLQPVACDELAELELQYTRAYLLYCEQRYDQCCTNLESIVQQTSFVSNDRRHFAFQQDAYAIRAKAATLLGVISGSRDQFSETERWHFEAILSAEKSLPRDTFLEAVILANLACAVGEVYCPSAMRLLQNRLTSLEWTPALDESRLYVRRNLRRANNLFGLRHPSEHEALDSPSLAWRLAESVDKLNTESWPSRQAYQEELVFAKTFIKRIDWSATSGEESTELHQLALALAPFDVAGAFEAKTSLEIKLKDAWPHFPTGRTARDKALSHFAAGCIAKASMDWAVAESEYRSAIQGLLESRIFWRSSIAAVELFTLTREENLLDIPRTFVAAHPGTPFSIRLERSLKFALEAERGTFAYLDAAISA